MGHDELAMPCILFVVRSVECLSTSRVFGQSVFLGELDPALLKALGLAAVGGVAFVAFHNTLEPCEVVLYGAT